MATRDLLKELSSSCERETGTAIHFDSMGGVDAAARVEAGEACDLVVLAEPAITRLHAAGRVGEPVVLAVSEVAIAVPSGAPRVDLSSATALREAMLGASRIGYSTGPSGTALLQLIESWGIGEILKDRLVQARPGIPVAALLASGEAQLGFQQLSELQGQPGIEMLGKMPPGTEIVTRFVGAVCTRSEQADAAKAALAFMAEPARDAIRRAQGMSITMTSSQP